MKVTHTDTSTIFEFLTDSKGVMKLDVRCPVSCGECCGYWKDVTALERLIQEIYPQYRECPHLSDEGCKLPRNKRPVECTAYICELGILAVEKMVTEEEIDRTIENCRQLDAFSYLGKRPKTKDVKSVKEMKVKTKDKKKLRKLLKEREAQCAVTKASITSMEHSGVTPCSVDLLSSSPTRTCKSSG